MRLHSIAHRYAAVLAAVLAGPIVTRAQVPMDTSGRLMDANPMIGGTRFNDRVQPFSPMIGGNPYATGNVRGGLSLRSFEPISDTTAFRGTLGSSSLSDFIRDSVSVADIYSPNYGMGIGPRPYFDPGGTVPTVGYLQNRYTAYRDRQDGSVGTVGNPLLAAPGLLNYGGSVSPPLPPARPNNALTPPSSAGSMLMPAPLGEANAPGTGVFGVHALGPRVPQSMQAPGALNPGDGPASPSPWWPAGREPVPTTPTTRLDLRERAMPIGTPIDALLRGDSAALLESRRPSILPPPPAVATGATAAPARTATGATESPVEAPTPPVRIPTLRDTSMLPGHDKFTDMRLALTLAKDPSASWWTEMQDALREAGPTGAREAQARAAMEAQEFLNSVMNSPITTFVGQEQTLINDELLKAEGLLHIGQYYDAAAKYQYVHMLDPTNPLPLVGRGHALLAAGDYLSAAIQLVRGFERFPDLTRFEVDLRSFLGDGEIIDIRRADLMNQLARGEDAQLRFLLGYLEYYTGDKQRGLDNLERAAETADIGSLIRRFPDMLRGRGMLPPPRLDAPPGGDESPRKEPGE